MDKRIIEGSEPASPLIKVAAYNTTDFFGMPIKLAIAKDLMVARITGIELAGFKYNAAEVSERSIKDAQALIDAYNNQ